MISLYFDHDSSSRETVPELRRLGIDVLTARANNATLDDEGQLEFAYRAGRVLYAANVRDFEVLHRRFMEAGRTHQGIILRFHQRMPVGEQVRLLHAIWRTLTVEDFRNRTLFLDTWRPS